MNYRVIVPLSSIGTLVLDRDTFDAALAAGVSLGRPAPPIAASTVDVLLTPEQLAERLRLPQS